ncbi:MAG: hypothetical protein AAF628_29070 [Planctomycetota bacterium]
MTTMEAAVGQLPVEIGSVRLAGLSLGTRAGWTRRTTVVCLAGGGVGGSGEDVTYDAAAHAAWQSLGAPSSLQGRYTLAEFSHRLDALDLRDPPGTDAARPLFRRWAFESAALDLALRQAGRSLADCLGRSARPLNFVVSLGLGDPPSTRPITELRAANPGLRFKVDLSAAWTEAFIAELAELNCVDVVDLKGLYRGAFQGPPANVQQYRWIAERLPDCWLEDPELNDATRATLEPHMDRLTWDANQHAVADLLQLEREPRCINVKPSRYGFLAELLRLYAHCEARGIAMYAGGQFELGPGRRQIQALASLFHSAAPNDAAPREFNEGRTEGLPSSPLSSSAGAVGFGNGE